MDSKLSRLCDGLLEAGWLAAVISVPLFFNIHSERVFEPDKLTLLRSIAVFMALIWIVKFVDQRGWQRFDRLSWRHQESFWHQPFVLPIVALVLIYLVSTLFSIMPRVSWAGSYQRLQGTYTTLSYIIIAGAAASTIRSRVQIGRIISTAIITSIPIALYGLLQHFALDPLPWGGDVVIRVAGHMGNAIFIAAYLIMIVPLTLARIVDAFTNILGDENLAVSDVVRSAIYIFALAIQLLVIYWSGSRGPLIALATALFSFTLVLLVSLRDASGERGALRLKDAVLALTLLLPAIFALFLANAVLQSVSSLASFAFYMAAVLLSVASIIVLLALRKGWRWLWLSWLLLTAFVAAWLLLFNVPAQQLKALGRVPLVGAVLDTQLAWKELPVVGSYGRMLDPAQTAGREKSNRVRVLIWEGVIDLIGPHAPLEYPDGSSDKFNFLRPLIGYGPESMYVAYNRFYPPELATVEARNASPDRSHNETFDALVITGLAGFLAWQALYLSAFYYGFRYLGVVGSRRERNILIAAWIGAGLLGGVLSLTVFEPIYFGVAVPAGTIIALVGYLFYYALFGKGQASGSDGPDSQRQPFHIDRLLMNGLLAAVLAHYVEIHFGIAISSTRMYFFLFVAIMFLISSKLPRTAEEEQSDIPPKRKRRLSKQKRQNLAKGRWGPVLMWSFLLALMVGILGFEYINYVLPEGKTIASGVDLPAGDIFYQSLLVNPMQGFSDSPFIYLMIVLSWTLGCLIVLSEMVKQKELSFTLQSATRLRPRYRNMAALGLAVLAIGGLTLRFLYDDQSSVLFSFGGSVVLIGAVVCVWSAVMLLRDGQYNRVLAVGIPAAVLLLTLGILYTDGLSIGIIFAALCMVLISLWAAFWPPQEGAMGQFIALVAALTGLLLSLLILTSGGWLLGLLLAIFCLPIIFLLWDDAWQSILRPSLVMAATSWIIGLAYTYLHTVNLREALLYLTFFQGAEPISTLYTMFFKSAEVVRDIPQLRVLEAQQSMRLLSWFYIYLFAMLLLSGVSLAWHAISSSRVRGSSAAYSVLFISVLLGIIVIGQTNLRVVQADMMYKRGKPFDDLAVRQTDPVNWDVAIAIYEEALDLAPWEDFYYLFLGRAFLERSAASADSFEQDTLYRKAEEGLLQAQAINPLNTDHTANLARLFTRWYAADRDSDQSAKRLQESEEYYRDALALSPQNSIVRNEYARLILEIKQSCDQSLAIYDRSLEIDPFYSTTYFALTDALVACAAAQTDETQQTELYRLAAKRLAEGLSLEPERERGWMQSGQILHRIGDYEAALASYERARDAGATGTVPSWNIDFAVARVYQDSGEISLARAMAEQALQTAPADVADQITAFIAQLGEG